MTTNSLIGIAGVHYVVSELSRRGMIALPTVKNTAAYDIVALNTEGTRHANIQVKASSKRVTFFPMPPPKKIRVGSRDFYVLVRWVETEGRFEGFLLTGREALQAVNEMDKAQKRNIRGGSRNKTFPAAYVGPSNGERAGRWHKAWAKWSLQ